MKQVLITLLILNSCGKSNDDSGNSQASSDQPAISTSYYVDTEDQLVACDNTRKGYLAYVKKISEFKACVDGGWSTVNVKGKDGSNGSNGSSGAAGTPTSANQWYDAITTKMWVMTTIATTVAGWNNSMSACTGDYRMPSPTEVSLALTHGMKAVAQALVNPPTFILANDGQTYVVNTGLLGSNATAAQFCIAK